MNNREIANLFSLLSKLMDVHQENSFKIKTYSNAAFTIDKLPFQLNTISREQISLIKGIGNSLSQKIVEILDSGQLQSLNELLDKTPKGILELMQIKGIGAKKIAVIWHELGIETPGELLYACNENRLIHYKGFGEKTQTNIKEALEYYFSNQGYYLYAQVEALAMFFQNELEELFGAQHVKCVGAFARQEDTIEELEWVLLTKEDEAKKIFSNLPELDFLNQEHQTLFYKYKNIIKINFHLSNEKNFAKDVFIKSCSNTFLSDFERCFNIKIEHLDFNNEEDLYHQLNIIPIPYYSRSLFDKIICTNENNYEDIIKVNDIKGIIHNHSVWSDGAHTIEEMAMACIKKGYEYLVMSDHSISSFYANGLSIERIQKQHIEIDKLNKQLAPFKIFKSIECDILYDGSLDYENSVLALFDLVIVSIHQQLNMNEEKAMERLLKAIENPYSTILGHCTGRLLLSRKGYPIRHEEIIKACKQHHVAIEINANPRRLDMDWQWIKLAQEEGVLLSINPDAHHIDGINDVRYGVLSAQKGLLKKENNLSSKSLIDFEKYLEQIKIAKKM